MNLSQRFQRHVRLTSQSVLSAPETPPFLILFVNSICNQTCEHCFYWRNLNRKDDLTFEELSKLSADFGRIENLNLSGGEPFLRKDLAEVCRMFIRNNGVRQIYVPTNGSFEDRTIDVLTNVLKEPGLDLFACEISLDGTEEFHNRFRGMKDAFDRAMRTYDALAKLQQQDARLRIHCISTATSSNLGEIRELTGYLRDRCPQMDHHNLAIIRGDRKNPSLEGPTLDEYRRLYEYVKQVWAVQEEDRYGAIVEPMLQWAKVRTANERRQVVPCTAGRMTGVVYSNGDVSVCEQHAPIGNLRNNSFREIWNSEEAKVLRRSIANKDCYCTNEVFLWPSIVFQPAQLVKAMVGSKAWRGPAPGPAASAPTAPFNILQ